MLRPSLLTPRCGFWLAAVAPLPLLLPLLVVRSMDRGGQFWEEELREEAGMGAAAELIGRGVRGRADRGEGGRGSRWWTGRARKRGGEGREWGRDSQQVEWCGGAAEQGERA
jgi:hypothetical protein